jgi:hypothetical protein
VCYYFSAIESNEECTEEGEVFEYQEEENQGQATQGKPSKVVAYLNPIHLILQVAYMFIKLHVLYIAIAPIAALLQAQAPQAYYYHPS